MPDASLGVPDGAELTYQFIPEDPGTYMYHCHVEDVEHVTMGLHGMVFVRPRKGQNFAYNDTDDSTQFDRQFAILLTDLDVENHWNDGHIQVSDWSQFRTTFGLMNGRGWPDTIEPNGPFFNRDTGLWHDNQITGPRLAHNPNSSLIQANAGERVLLRISNLGFDEKSLVLPGLPVTIHGRDAKWQGEGRADYSGSGTRGSLVTTTNRIDIGPGESRDVIFTAPDAPVSSDANSPDVYPFYDRSIVFRQKQSGAGGSRDGFGSTRTEVHVYPVGYLGAQAHPNQVFPRPNGSYHS